LFDRPFRAERTNLVDGLAAAANLVMGETNECTPLVLARDVPHLSFVAGNTDAEIFAAAEHDYFKVLYRKD
jgi:F420-0:gamma-glutamyl ligase